MKIIIIGTGNVAHQMGQQLNANGVKISSIIGRNQKKAKALADLLNCNYNTDFKYTNEKNCLYILAVSDQAIEEVSKKIKNDDALMIHTSGSMDIDLLTSKNHGVVWPLYSLNKDTVINWKDVPLIIEFTTNKTKHAIDLITNALGGSTYKLDSKQRAHAHLLAVFINNFSQHLFALIKEHQDQMGINPEMYTGIMKDTIDKILHADLKSTLTGPARRNDTVTMDKHLALLKDIPNMKSLYENFSKSIVNKYHGEEL